MLTKLYANASPVINKTECQPCISILLSFEPKMNSKAILRHSLKLIVDKIKRELEKNFTHDLSDDLLERLQHVIEHLDYTTHKKSIALYVSTAVEKVYYLDIEVQEKIMIDTSFEIRDIIRNKKSKREFLLLTINGKSENIYVGDGAKLQLIVSNSASLVQRDLPQRVANFTDASAVKETEEIRFLHYIDNKLSAVLKLYPFPLFITAPKKKLGYFQNITIHQKNINGIVHGSFNNATEAELLKLLEPQLDNWHAVRDRHIINQLKIAQDNCKLATGIHEVWMQANQKHKQLLVVENNFYCPAFVTDKGETIFAGEKENVIIAKDAVDDVIEKVLTNGGDVEFVDDLKMYNGIALITQNNFLSIE